MAFWKIKTNRIRVICLFLLFIKISCSGALIKCDTKDEQEEPETRTISLISSSSSFGKFDNQLINEQNFNNILSWLQNHLTSKEIAEFDWTFCSLKKSDFPPSLLDIKIIFEFVEILLINGFKDLGSKVIKFIKNSIYYCDTCAVLIRSLSLENLAVFNLVLEIWYPSSEKIIIVMKKLVKSRRGEDWILYMINIVWDRLVSNLEPLVLNAGLSNIVFSAISEFYVSLLEDILERQQGLIQFINDRLDNTTIIHYFCKNMDPKEFNETSNDHSIPGVKRFYNSLHSTYPSANYDILSTLMAHGADINACNYQNLTPLNFAILLKRSYMVEVLLHYHFTSNTSITITGLNFLDFFKLHYDKEVYKVLRKYGLIPHLSIRK